MIAEHQYIERISIANLRKGIKSTRSFMKEQTNTSKIFVHGIEGLQKKIIRVLIPYVSGKYIKTFCIRSIIDGKKILAESIKNQKTEITNQQSSIISFDFRLLIEDCRFLTAFPSFIERILFMYPSLSFQTGNC